MNSFDEDLNDFIKKIQPKGNEKYRLIARFKHKTEMNENEIFERNTFATIRFGDNNE